MEKVRSIAKLAPDIIILEFALSIWPKIWNLALRKDCFISTAKFLGVLIYFDIPHLFLPSKEILFCGKSNSIALFLTCSMRVIQALQAILIFSHLLW